MKKSVLYILSFLVFLSSSEIYANNEPDQITKKQLNDIYADFMIARRIHSRCLEPHMKHRKMALDLRRNSSGQVMYASFKTKKPSPEPIRYVLKSVEDLAKNGQQDMFASIEVHSYIDHILTYNDPSCSGEQAQHYYAFENLVWAYYHKSRQ